MSPQLPSFLRRRMRLSEARKALLGGEPEAALRSLEDPCLEGVEEAAALLERVLDVLCREAARACVHDPEVSERRFGLVERHDPARVRVWRRRLESESADPEPSADLPAAESGIRPASEVGLIGALERLLGEMRDDRSRSGVRHFEDEAGAASGDRRARIRAQDSADHRPSRREDERRFKLAVDDVGEFLVCFSPQVTIGHAQAEQSDLPILADIDPLHVRLVRTESFHAGPGWRIEPIGDQRIALGGELLDAGGGALLDGDEVQVSPNLAFVFRRPEAASGSAVLELLHGAECAGVRRVLLFATGEEGRVRIGPGRGRHLRARRLEDEVSLWIDGGELVVESAADLHADGDDVAVQAAGPGGPGGLRLPCPPEGRVGFAVGRGGPKGPPFGVSMRSLEHGPRGSIR